MAVMDALRILAFRREQTGVEKGITLFHRLFLQIVERFGRVHQHCLTGMYNLLPLNPWRDWRLATKLLAKGKLKLAFPNVKGVREFQEVFRRVRELRKESL
jgi:hypothetical protein